MTQEKSLEEIVEGYKMMISAGQLPPASWLHQALTEVTQAAKEWERQTAVALVKEFKDRLIDVAITNEHLRGCVTSNQIIEEEKVFWASTHEALTPNVIRE